MGLKEIMNDGVDWILLTQDRFQCWADVNIVMNLVVSQRDGEVPDHLSDYQLVKDCYMELVTSVLSFIQCPSLLPF
jgi:hypothetical protein